MASLRTTSASPAASCRRATTGHRRASVVATAGAQGRREEVHASPIMMAAVLALSGGLSLAPMVAPPAAHADSAESRKEAVARRKALLAESRARAEASFDRAKVSEDKQIEADAEVDRKNAERARLAAERAAAIDAIRNAEYQKAADRALKEVPPV